MEQKARNTTADVNLSEFLENVMGVSPNPNKAEFIRAKYQMLAFVHRLPCRDDDSVTAKDLSKQLHSSVRTGNLETCLRLLSLGAQANFFNPEKGSTPLHVAAKAGQILQAELLTVYGADPGHRILLEKHPLTMRGGHHELADRLVEIQHELTDRLAFYLCGRKPDHRSGQHFIIPHMADRAEQSTPAPEPWLKIRRGRLVMKMGGAAADRRHPSDLTSSGTAPGSACIVMFDIKSNDASNVFTWSVNDKRCDMMRPCPCTVMYMPVQSNLALHRRVLWRTENELQSNIAASMQPAAPIIVFSSLDLSELAKAAKKKLQSLSNHLFEELAMDVYDEVDRRETDAVWLATQNHSTLVTETTVVPFLPVNPEYSSTRNQGRQKLARFNAHEFATLVIDILSDAKRRQQGNLVVAPKDNVELVLKSISNQHSIESQDNDQPDYDSVASDEETDLENVPANSFREKSLESDLSDGTFTVQEFLEVKNALTASESKIQQLMKVNSNLSDELRIMQKKCRPKMGVAGAGCSLATPAQLSYDEMWQPYATNIIRKLQATSHSNTHPH
ncbi:unnamed protein product [Ranitomeya imitator]|uniref:GIT Spa2 homology (SHD) domain-containing protein n=1 Tax=Ranitomeya imitator TaxID=111125 RepID=A0ABN9L2A7_9NEOB|nr:unnamed protein product [Ranitomeya imitator]